MNLNKLKTWVRSFVNADVFTRAFFEPVKKYKDDVLWVALATQKIVTTLISTEMNFYKLVGDKIVELEDDHIVRQIFIQPDGELTFTKWIKKLLGLYLLNGEVYIYLDDKSRLKLKLRIGTKYEDGLLTINGQNIKVPEGKIIKFINPDFKSELVPYNLRDKIALWIQSDWKLNQLFDRVAKNGSVVGGVLKTPLRNEEELRKFAAEWNAQYEGFEKNVKDILLPYGYEYEVQQIAPKDVNLETLLSRSSKQILMAFGVPETLFGVVDGKGRANIDGAYYGFIKFTIVPLLDELYELMNDFILPKIDKEVFFDYKDPVPKDKLTDAQVRRLELGGKAWKTPNEVRQELGLEPLEGNDALNEPMFLKVPGRIRRQLKKNIQKRKMDEIKEAIEKALEEPEKIEFDEKQLKHFDKLAEQRAVIITPYARKLYDILREAKKRKVENFVEDVINGNVELKRIKKLETRSEFELDPKVVAALLKELVRTQASDVLDRLDVETDFELNRKVEKEIHKLWKMREESWDETTEKKILETTREALKEGVPRDELAQRLGEVVDSRLTTGLEILAHDVVYTLSNYATNEAFIQSRVVKRKIWFAVGDERTCAQCGAMHGRVVDVKESFLKNGEEFIGLDGKKYKNTFGSKKAPPLHPACRCDIIADVEITK